VPFVRSYVCELNFSCYHQKPNSFFDTNIYEVTNLTFNMLQLANQPDVSTSISTLIQFMQTIQDQRAQAAVITQNLSLADSIQSNETQFKDKLAALGLSPSPLGDSLLGMILGSTPNFNYLYSNFSANYTEPVNKWMHLGINQNLVNLLYGPDLDVGYL
jgi:hypothetical protein